MAWASRRSTGIPVRGPKDLPVSRRAILALLRVTPQARCPWDLPTGRRMGKSLGPLTGMPMLRFRFRLSSGLFLARGGPKIPVCGKQWQLARRMGEGLAWICGSF